MRKSRWSCWAPVPNKPTVSVDVKNGQAKQRAYGQGAFTLLHLLYLQILREMKSLSLRLSGFAKIEPISKIKRSFKNVFVI